MDNTLYLERFPSVKVAVIGEAMLDRYLIGNARSLCREACVPAVRVEESRDIPGGGANTARNAAALGARTSFLSIRGNDPEGELLAKLLRDQGVDTERIFTEGHRRTLTKNRIIARSHMLARFEDGERREPGPPILQKLITALRQAYVEADAVILSDYSSGLFGPLILKELIRLRKLYPRVLIVGDSKNPARLKDTGLTAIKPNYEEALGLLGLPPAEEDARVEQISDKGKELLRRTGARICAVTMDRHGCLMFERGGPAYRTYVRRQRDLRTTGAGDTFTAALTLALAAGADTSTAAELASAAAGVVTEKEITSACSLDELRGAISGRSKFIPGTAALASLCRFYREKGLRLVFTNGCFDILHRGHVTHLNRSKELGDILIVGINADAGVSRLKGSGRPINCLEDRIQIISALSCVDHVAVFEENTSDSLIRSIRPDIYTKGGDYSRQQIPESSLLCSLGIPVRILPYLEQYSTVRLIHRVQKQCVTNGTE